MVRVTSPDPSTLFSLELRGALASAREIARQAGATSTDPDHLACALLVPSPAPEGGQPLTTLAADLLAHLDFDVGVLYRTLYEGLTAGHTPVGRARPVYGSAATLLIAQAGVLALADGKDVEVTSTHLLLALVEGVEHDDISCVLVERLAAADVTLTELRAKWHQMRRALASGSTTLARSLDEHPGQSTALDFAVDLTASARAGKLDPIIGRDDEIGRVIRILSRRTKNNPVLLGLPGTGKTAIVEGLAQRIVTGNVPERLRGKRILAFTPAAVVAGTKYRGDFEARVLPFLRSVRDDPETILFIDELHTIVGAGTGGMNESGDLSTIMKPMLARGELHCLGATTLDDYRKYIESDTALERRFAPVTVKEPTDAEALAIVAGLSARYGAFHHVTYPEAVLEACVALPARHLPNRRFPDKAIDVLDEAGSAASLAGRPEVAIGDVLAAVAAMAGTTVEALAAEPVSGSLSATLSSRIIGQPAAVAIAATIVESRRMGLTERLAPLATFLFVGPTGSGKSALAAALADAEFEGNITSIDLASYSERQSASGLIGAPPSYVGYDEPARLVEPVRRRPAQVVLLRHLDAAAPEVRALLTDVLRTGELADTHDRRASFRDAVVVFTVTQAGTGAALGFATPGASAISAGLEAKMRALLGADLLDLVDAVVPFTALDETSLEAIAEAQLAEIQASLARRHHIELAVTPAVRKAIVAGAGRNQGARPIRRVVERLVERSISSAFAKPSRRAGRYVLDMESGSAVVHREEEPLKVSV